MLEPNKINIYIRGLAEGLSHAEIAESAGVCVRTVYNWRRSLIASMGCKTIFQAIMLTTVDLVKNQQE